MRRVVILAGGQGQRMGGLDKGAIDLNGERMIDCIYRRLGPQCDQVLLSGHTDYGLGCESISDLKVGPKGPAAGLYASWTIFKATEAQGFFTVPVDGPNLPQDLIARLYCVDSSAIARDDNGLHPAFAWWRLADLGKVWAALDLDTSISLKYLARMTGAKCVNWAGKAMFRNINTPEDLAGYQNDV